MYRPTVRYAECYQQYVDKMFLSTTLDRNQIIRAALLLGRIFKVDEAKPNS